MGIYLNPSHALFKRALRADIYVDKTDMVARLNAVVNTPECYVSVSRPRRFGKTMAADMICAYYGREADARQLFEGRKLAKTPPVKKQTGETIAWDGYLGKFDVIRIVMTDFIGQGRTVREALHLMETRILRELTKTYPDVDYDTDDFFYSMESFYSVSHYQFVIIIDEWDAVLRTLSLRCASNVSLLVMIIKSFLQIFKQ